MSVPPGPTPDGAPRPSPSGVPTTDGGSSTQDPGARDTGTPDGGTAAASNGWAPAAHDSWTPPAQERWAPGTDPAPAPLAWGPPQVWAPSWEQPPLGSPIPPGPGSAAGPPAAPPAGPARSRGVSPWLVVLVAVAALLAGAAGAGLVTTALFASGAEELGREMAEEMAPRVATDVGDEVAASIEDAMGAAMDDVMGGGIYEEPAGPVEQFPPTAPGDLGPDPVLDDYADSCFAGDLQACDDLFYGAPPLSDYEAYAGTCGGRVKLYEVMYCIDLE